MDDDLSLLAGYLATQSFVIYCDAARPFEATYGLPSDEGDDPRTNLGLPFGLKRC